MRWLAPFILILAAAPGRAQEGESEKLYRAMEKKIRAAKSLVVEFNSQHTVDDKTEPSKFTVKGTIYVALGNKTRLDLESELFQLGGKNLIVTNGESKFAKVGNLVFHELQARREGNGRQARGAGRPVPASVQNNRRCD
jgi:hypothetical protein